MKLELERAKHVARTNFDDKINAAKERDQVIYLSLNTTLAFLISFSQAIFTMRPIPRRS